MNEWNPQQRYRLLESLTKHQLQELVMVWLADVGPTVDQSVEIEMRLGLVNYCNKSPKRWKTIFERAKTYNASAYEQLASEASENAAKQALLAGLGVAQPIAPTESGPTTMPTPAENVSHLFKMLVRINFVKQVSFYQDVMRESPRAAFWVRGGDVSARRALLYRLINPSTLNDAATPTHSTALRNGPRIDFRDGSADAQSIWAETADKLGQPFDETELSKQRILKQLSEVLKTQDFIIVLRNVDEVLHDTEVRTGIVSFWQTVMNHLATQMQPKRLLLFLVEENRTSAQAAPMSLTAVDWKAWKQGHDCRVPLQLMADETFPDHDLEYWFTAHAPPAISEKLSYQDLWAACDNGKPQKIYEKACFLCNESPKNFDNWLRQL